MLRIKLLIFTIIAILLAGCAKPSSVTYTPPVLEGNWSVRMTLSGGIAGLLQNIEVKSDGRYIVIDERANNIVEGKLSANELAALEELVSTLEFSAQEIPTGCADCFVYDVEIESGGRKMIVNADDVSLSDSGLGSLVQFLRGIMGSALQ